MTRRYDSILETIGNTPIVKLNKLAPDHVNLYVKVESFNPMGSVKDRLALSVIENAEKSGTLKPGQTVIEATSGNTGIGLAMVCAAKGYPLVVTMSESFSIERRKMMRFLGARVVLTPAALKGSGMLAKAVELAEEHDWFLVRQFENEANADAHMPHDGTRNSRRLLGSRGSTTGCPATAPAAHSRASPGSSRRKARKRRSWSANPITRRSSAAGFHRNASTTAHRRTATRCFDRT